MQKTESTKRAVEALRRRYTKLAERLGKTTLIAQGTITERTIVRTDPEDGSRKKAYGPYFQWTFKRAGKTTTVNLSASQSRAYQRAIRNHRRMEKILQEMREVSLKILEASTVGVKRRKRQI